MPSINSFIQNHHLVKGLDPVADAFATTVYSDIVNLSKYGRCDFVLYKGVGTTGTSTLTVQACDDVSASNTSDVPFHYRAITSGDTPGANTAATSTGFVTTAGSSQLYVVEIDAEAIVSSGYKYARLKCVESVDAAVLGSILVILSNPRYAQDVTPTAIT
jgi:hypothetical protein